MGLDEYGELFWHSRRSAGGRALSEPENLGWRQFWDGWDICPDCIVRKVGSVDRWPVPANYGMRIKADAKCSRCGCSPAST